ncbi:hypothetical protein GCM10010317_101670 [Streptomyces mirabilis]|nr:hypothetical protein GCM10010317_101670 [Streptomyces mirabilis]
MVHRPRAVPPLGQVRGLPDAGGSGGTLFNKIKEWRGLAIHHDKTPPGNLAERHLSGAVIWLRSLR